MPLEEQERRYAFLLATAEDAALRAAHEWAVGALSAGERAALVESIQDHTLAGVRLTPRDVCGLARLLASAERRRPGQVLAALPTALRVRVHATVLGALTWDEAAYAAWEPPLEPVDELPPLDRGWDSIDDNQVYRFTHHSQEVIGGSQAVFRRRRG